jgi:hypothetical protein
MPNCSKNNPSTAEGEHDDVTAGNVDDAEPLPPEREPDARDAPEVRAWQDDAYIAAHEEDRRRELQRRERQSDRIRRWFRRRPIRQRPYFSMAEIVDKLTPFIAKGGQIVPDSEAAWEIAQRLAAFMVSRPCSNRGEIILLGNGAARLTGQNLRMVWHAAMGDWEKLYPRHLPTPSF